MLFERRTNEQGQTEVEFGRLSFTAEHNRDFMKFNETGTRPNELFLTKTVLNRVEYFKEVYDWFDEKLRLVFPSPRSAGVETTNMTESDFEKDSRESFSFSV